MKPITIHPFSFLAGSALSLVAIVAMGQNQVDSGPIEELVVRRLVVVDENGRPRIILGQDPADTQRRSRSVGLTLHDPDGAERFGLSVMDDGTVGLGLDAPLGVGSPMRDRLAMGVNALGQAYFMMINNDTAVPVRLLVDDSGVGKIEFLGDYDTEANKLRYRRLGLDGDEEGEIPIHDR